MQLINLKGDYYQYIYLTNATMSPAQKLNICDHRWQQG